MRCCATREALLASDEGGDPFLRSPAMKQLAASEEATVGPALPGGQAAEPRTGPAGTELEAVLRLLEPAQRPNSLGDEGITRSCNRVGQQYVN